MYFASIQFDSELQLYSYASPVVSCNKLHQLMHVSVDKPLQPPGPKPRMVQNPWWRSA